MRQFVEALHDYTDNELTWLLIFQSFMYYALLSIVSPLPGPDPILYTEMEQYFHAAPVIWGSMGVAATISLFVGIWANNNKYIVIVSSWAHFALWAFAFGAYVTSGVYGLGIAIPMVQLLFWGWNRVKRRTVHNRKHT